MTHNAAGLPTFARHLRVIVNENFAGATPPKGDRGSLALHVNAEFGKPHLIKGRTWSQSLEGELDKRTGCGTTAVMCCLRITEFPSRAVIEEAQRVLAERGIRLEVHAHRDEDGSFPVWLTYINRAAGQEQ